MSALPDRLSTAQLCDLAIADLARRFDIPANSIAVRTLESVDWPDASLGCPEPGFMYAQVITPGYRIILEAGGRMYAYHASLRGVKFCAQPALLPPDHEGQIQVDEPYDLHGGRS